MNPVVALIGGIMKRGVTMSRCYYVCLILLLLCGCIQAPTINESGVVDVKHIEELLPFHSCVYKVNPINELDWTDAKIVKTNDINLAMVYLGAEFPLSAGYNAIFVDPNGTIEIGTLNENGESRYYHGYEPGLWEVDWASVSKAQADKHSWRTRYKYVFPQGEFHSFSGVKFVQEGENIFPAFYEVGLNYYISISGEPFYACFELILKDHPIEIIELQREDEWPFPMPPPGYEVPRISEEVKRRGNVLKDCFRKLLD